MLPGSALKRAATLALVLGTSLTPAALDSNPALVVWREGPGTSGRGPDQVHYVTCVPAADPVNGPLTEVLVDAADAYPMPDPATGLHRYSQGQPCPNGPART
jgi:hypothetical protein